MISHQADQQFYYNKNFVIGLNMKSEEKCGHALLWALSSDLFAGRAFRFHDVLNIIIFYMSHDQDSSKNLNGFTSAYHDVPCGNFMVMTVLENCAWQ